MEIIKATIEDAEEILALQKRAYESEAKLNNDYSIPPLTQTLDEILEEFETQLFLKAVQDGKIVGSVRGYRKNDTCHIGRLVVEEAYQNQGIGKKLLKAIEEAFAPIRRYELFTSTMSEKNIYLYQKAGYSIYYQVPLNDKTTLVFLEKLY